MRLERRDFVAAAAVVVTALLIIAAAAYSPRVVGALATADHVTVLWFSLTGGALYLTPWVTGALLGVAGYALVARFRGVPRSAIVVAGLFFLVGLAVGAKLQYRLEIFKPLGALLISPRDLLEPGGRLPLGLLLGGLLALARCGVAGISWRAVGDGLAVFESVMSTIGRLGCLLAGCCMGGACPPWMSAICLRYPRGTPAFDDQVAAKLLDPASVLSLPAHPLPAYFALAALLILTVLLLLLRYGAPAGSLLTVFGILWPPAKIGLEAIRAVPRQGSAMLVVPLLLFLLTVGGLAVQYARNARRRGAVVTDPGALLMSG